jgi:NTP pyrophosphatase (non-canonical NTP hydrolase)
MQIQEFQKQIETLYFERDKNRGLEGTFRWFVEEVGELARAIRKQDRENLELEFSDCFAWLVTLASLSKIDMEQAIQRYVKGCPKCHATPCSCSENSASLIS